MAKVFSISIKDWLGRFTGGSPKPNLNNDRPPKTAAAPEQDEDPVSATIDQHAREAFQDALDSVALSPDPTRVTAHGDAVEGATRRLHKGPFDLDNPTDADLQRRYDEEIETGRKDEDDVKRSGAARMITERDVPPAEPGPQVSQPVIVFGAAGFAFAFGSCLKELPVLRSIEPDGLGLWIAFLIGLCLGGLSVASLFGLKVYDAKASPIWSPQAANPAWPMIAGLVFIAAFTLIRLAVSEGPEDYLFTFALAGIDIGVLMYIKTEAASHRLREDAWAKRNDNRLQKQHLADIDKKREQDCIDKRDASAAKLKTIQAEFEARMRLDFDLDSAIEAGRAKVYQAYLSAIDKNQGRMAAGKAA